MRASRNIGKPIIYAPLVPFFVAAVVGILGNAWFKPGASFWRALLIVSVAFFFTTKLSVFFLKKTRLIRLLHIEIAWHFSYLEAWFSFAFFSGLIWIWFAFAALAGLRHEYYYNIFPLDEIGFYTPPQGVASTVEFRIISAPTFSEYENDARPAFGVNSATRFNANVCRVKDNGVWKPFSGKIAVSISGKATNLHVGDLVKASGKLAPPSLQNNPGDRDRVFFYRSQRILTLLRVHLAENVELLSSDAPSCKYKILRILERIRIKSACLARERLSKRNASVATGMTLGFRNDVDDDTLDKFRRTGTIHLLAISGLHVMLVVGAIAFFFRMIGVPLRLTCVATLCFVFVYLGLTDMRPPVIRATVLIVIMCLGSLINRQGFLLNSLACAALTLLVINPCELFQPGAQLSFLATGTFLWSDSSTPLEKARANLSRVDSAKKRRRQNRKRAPHRFFFIRFSLSLGKRIFRFLWGKTRGVAITGAIIWIVGTPLILSVTNVFAPIAIIANPLIWFPATVSLLLSFVLEVSGLFLTLNFMPSLFRVLTETLGIVTDKCFDLFLGLLDYLSSIKCGAFHLPAPPEWSLWLFYLPLIFFTVFVNYRPKKRSVAVFLGSWFVFVFCVWKIDLVINRSNNTLDVDVFSVGHGCAVLGRFSDGRTFLYDCGSLENSERAAEIVAKNLWNVGRTSIDAVILSHADFDHYGGMETLLGLVNIKEVCASPFMFGKENESVASLRDSLERFRVDVKHFSAGDSLETLGFPELTVLHPSARNGTNEAGSTNGQSVVLAVDFCDRIIILPGDLDSKDAVFLRTPSLKCDFVLAPHHGGHSDNAKTLYEWTNPEYVGISGGSFLRNYAMEDELKARGFRVAHTFDDGDIQMRVERDPEDPDGRGRFIVSTYKTGRSSQRGAF